MVKLHCLLVEVAGKRFTVTLDGGEGRDTISELKEAIKKADSHEIKCSANALRLFLAVKAGKWLDSESEDVDQLQNGEETALFEELAQGGDLELHASRSLYTLLQTMPEPSTDQIHVLVTVSPAQTSVVYTPTVDLVWGEKLLHFLEGEMKDKNVLPSSHVLDEENMNSPLVGRDEAIEKVVSSFVKTIRTAKSGYPDSNRPVLPVCAGMSGLGKTRMLEEGIVILQNMMKFNIEDALASVTVPYTKEYKPQPVERSLPIEASFSWRMLYRFFLAGNCPLSFDEWIRSRLPVNACHLTFGSAVDAIELKLRKKQQDSAVQLYLFLGIDDYELIEKIGARRSYPDTSTLKDPLLVHELVDAIVGVLCTPLPRLIVLPMFAGTNLDIGRYPSYYVTYPLSLNVLTMDEIFEVAGGDPSFAELLEYPQRCRDLMLLGGVPKWTVDYFTELKEIKVVSMENIQACFKRVWAKFVENHWRPLDFRTRIRLVAYAVLGGSAGSFEGKSTWSELQNSSACFMVRSQRYYLHDQVRVPYALVRSLAIGYAGTKTDANLTIEEEMFVKSLNDLHEYVDKTMFDRPMWESSAMFRACFYAVRINALLVLGHAEVGLDMLFRGARMDRGMKFISVKLVPSRVFPCAEKFDASTPATITRQENPSETIDWTSRGCIAVNIDGGEAGADIFFALEKATRPGELILPGNLIVFVDQRKRRFRELQPSNPDEHLNVLAQHFSRSVRHVWCEASWAVTSRMRSLLCLLII